MPDLMAAAASLAEVLTAPSDLIGVFCSFRAATAVVRLLDLIGSDRTEDALVPRGSAFGSTFTDPLDCCTHGQDQHTNH